MTRQFIKLLGLLNTCTLSTSKELIISELLNSNKIVRLVWQWILIFGFSHPNRKKYSKLFISKVKGCSPPKTQQFFNFFPSAVSAQGELTGFTCQDSIWALRVLFSSCHEMMKSQTSKPSGRYISLSVTDFISSCRSNNSLKAWIHVLEGLEQFHFMGF